MSASIGIAFCADPTVPAESLIRNADVAMYRAKDQGRDQWVVFQANLDQSAVERLAHERALRLAIEGQQFVLHYQPVVQLSDGTMTQVEALIRWNRPGHELVMPNSFIPIAEETGLIVPIGWWVLGEAVTHAAAWPVLPGDRRVEMAVNLSARQLADPELVEVVADVLDLTGLDPIRLCFEVTESALVHDVSHAVASLNRLKGLGVRIAIDDFGTGYATLDYLRHFSMADYLKIDQAFVEGVDRAGLAARPPSCRLPSPWPSRSGSRWWPRGSRPSSRWRLSGSSAATWPRATCSADRSRSATPSSCWRRANPDRAPLRDEPACRSGSDPAGPGARQYGGRMPRAGSSRSLPVLVAGLAAVVAVAAGTRWLASVDVSSPAASLWAGRLGVDLVRFVFVLALVVGTIWLVAAIFVGDGGQRAEHRPKRRSPLTALVIAASWISLALLLAWLRDHIAHQSGAVHARGGGAAGVHPSTAHAAAIGGVADWVAVVVLAAIIAVGVSAWMLLPGRRRAVPSSSGPMDDESFDAAVAGRQADLEVASTDPRQAVLAAYHRLLDVLRSRGLARRASETPFEHLDRVLADQTSAVEPARSVVSAFELARFSDHEISPMTRDETLAALGTTLSVLEGPT